MDRLRPTPPQKDLQRFRAFETAAVNISSSPDPAPCTQVRQQEPQKLLAVRQSREIAAVPRHQHLVERPLQPMAPLLHACRPNTLEGNRLLLTASRWRCTGEQQARGGESRFWQHHLRGPERVLGPQPPHRRASGSAFERRNGGVWYAGQKVEELPRLRGRGNIAWTTGTLSTTWCASGAGLPTTAIARNCCPPAASA